MQALETLASALARELVKHGQSAQSARLAQDARLAYDELMVRCVICRSLPAARR